MPPPEYCLWTRDRTHPYGAADPGETHPRVAEGSSNDGTSALGAKPA